MQACLPAWFIYQIDPAVGLKIRGGAIINSKSFEGKDFVFNSDKIWRVGSKYPPLCPLASTGPAIISMRYHEQMRWTMKDERAEPWSKRNEKWIHNFGVQKIDGRTRESRKSHSWLASKVFVYKYCSELFLLVHIWVETVVAQKWKFMKQTCIYNIIFASFINLN